MNTPIDIERARELFDYNPETGVVTNKITRRKAKAGMTVGARHAQGYLVVSYDRTKYLLHRIVWALHYGEDPGEYGIDHVNGDRADNRIANLRKCKQSENTKNRRGKCYFKSKNRFQVQIIHNNERIYGGRFKTEEEAAKAAQELSRKLKGEFSPR